MKLLNEKHLTYFATCDSRVDKEGWLLKKGDVNKSFQRRWFSLKGNLLFYFEKRGDREPNGVIVLESYTVELCESSHSQFAFVISFKGVGCRSYVLSADTQESMESWMVAITSAGYDYMKLLLADLQYRLNALNSFEASRVAPPASVGGAYPDPLRDTELAAATDDASSLGSTGRVVRPNPFNACASAAGSQSVPPDFGSASLMVAGVDPLIGLSAAARHGSPVAAQYGRDDNHLAPGPALAPPVPEVSDRKDSKNGRGGQKPLTAFRVHSPRLGARSPHPQHRPSLRLNFLELQLLYGKQIDAFLVAKCVS